jgi:phosphocarrier protein HPr
MAERTVKIASSHGLHARPASLFTQAAARSGLTIRVAKGDRSVDASSILGVLSLGADQNDEVVISADGENADAVLDELETLLLTEYDAA